MKHFDFEKHFTNKNKIRPPTEWAKFFEARRISNTKVGEVLGVTSAQVWNWFTGYTTISKKHVAELEELKEMFLYWEEQNGRLFNSPDPVEERCPHYEDGVRFGVDFDKFDVCDECELRNSCQGLQN